ncbi:MAG: multicopper oxidase domain-containing protein, partial [Actinobacteria bacterium]|nr:multicopper oxidase domain-containing protein [Actinomycetota bacterium]
MADEEPMLRATPEIDTPPADNSLTRRAVLGSGTVLGAGAVGVALGRTWLAPDEHAHVGATPDPFDVGATSDHPTGKTREFWIQVDSFEHDLAPTGKDQMSGLPIDAGSAVYVALGFRAYTPHWTSPLAGNDDIGANTGIPGPIIRAEVGDTVIVHFRNNDRHYRWPHTMHPHGFAYTPASDGGFVAVQPLAGRSVPFGSSYTYTWVARASSAGTWLYHDHSMAQTIPAPPPATPGAVTPPMDPDDAGEPAFVDPNEAAGGATTPTGSSPADSMGTMGVMELSAQLGLFGLIAITDAHTADVDREHFLFFHDMYQADVPSLAQDFDCFNGRAFLGNTPTFE